jgi:hypothetical protein
MVVNRILLFARPWLMFNAMLAASRLAGKYCANAQSYRSPDGGCRPVRGAEGGSSGRARVANGHGGDLHHLASDKVRY